ncbi:crotonase/enoyl-CoA hydratase family protein [Rhodococcus fascians]|nr:crotonase/enoyl-CoA hydratase family protein [Rhodococcus fascians]MBY4238365.1 crotonase/enoyl-CoA hydratase family protein [Rhodococcus fascians]MBY4254254.1 crotonase/enoyl-CoA hydratase family protein [Rhodococcus fascians]MBY4269635.1 crotonase/enoyl-CoA hydratase family protein [Rhodococcus fascians]
MTYAETVEVDTSTEGVWVITINRPASRNAVNDAVARDMASALDEFDGTATARVAVLTGAGAGFSAGLDLKAFLDGELGEDKTRGFAGIAKKSPSKPIIAAIEGFALAGGFEIALACDLIVAATDARIALPEVKRGLVADGGSLLRLPRRIPYHIAMEIALTGSEIGVERLHRIGLVNVACEPGTAVESATALANSIVRNAPLAVAATKEIVQKSPQWTTEEAWDAQDAIARPVWESEDAEEGARAFAERRDPVFGAR